MSGKQPASSTSSGQCTAKGCKESSAQFNFCSTHFEHFKFGLIKKNGEPASDYEKKLNHFQQQKERTSRRTG